MTDGIDLFVCCRDADWPAQHFGYAIPVRLLCGEVVFDVDAPLEPRAAAYLLDYHPDLVHLPRTTSTSATFATSATAATSATVATSATRTASGTQTNSTEFHFDADDFLLLAVLTNSIQFTS